MYINEMFSVDWNFFRLSKTITRYFSLDFKLYLLNVLLMVMKINQFFYNSVVVYISEVIRRTLYRNW